MQTKLLRTFWRDVDLLTAKAEEYRNSRYSTDISDSILERTIILRGEEFANKAAKSANATVGFDFYKIHN